MGINQLNRSQSLAVTGNVFNTSTVYLQHTVTWFNICFKFKWQAAIRTATLHRDPDTNNQSVTSAYRHCGYCVIWNGPGVERVQPTIQLLWCFHMSCSEAAAAEGTVGVPTCYHSCHYMSFFMLKSSSQLYCFDGKQKYTLEGFPQEGMASFLKWFEHRIWFKLQGTTISIHCVLCHLFTNIPVTSQKTRVAHCRAWYSYEG